MLSINNGYLYSRKNFHLVCKGTPIMVRYEGLLLVHPNAEQTNIEGFEAAINKIIQEKQGNVLSFERWGKYRLAYPVSKNEYGIYFLVRFDIPAGTSTLADLKMLFETKLNNVILRNLFTRLSFDQPLAYQRPKSLEETPARESEGFDRRRDRGDRGDRGERGDYRSDRGDRGDRGERGERTERNERNFEREEKDMNVSEENIV